MSDLAVTTPFTPARLFQHLRWRLFRNNWTVLLGQSSIRPLTILMCSVIIWMFVFAISMGGFRFLQFEVKLPLGGDIVGTLIDLLFLALGVFLIFSSGLILYGSLFTSPETAFLLSKPVTADRIFAYKYQGAVAFSSWAFLLLGAPVLIAYGLAMHSPWYFYLFLPLFFLGFVLLPTSISSLCCLLIVNFVPRHRKQVVILGIVVVAALIFGVLWSMAAARRRPHHVMNRQEVNQLLDRFNFARGMAMPSHWVASGLRQAGKGNFAKACYFLALIWSNGLLVYLFAAWASLGLYRRGYNRIATGGTLRKRYGGAWLDQLLSGGLFFLKPTTRILLVKDFRTFRRDPQQWAQILIFSGLMFAYIINIRKMFITDIRWIYQNSISLMNLCAVALLVCTYTGRFVYPLLSLEGRKFWVLGLLPIKREQLLWGKFAFSTTGALLLAGLLVMTSDLMLEMPWPIVVLHMLAVIVLSAGLSGMSVGLGASMPNFRETDPSKIAVGFGGTLNLVACLLFLVLVLVMMAFPWHLCMVTADSGYSREPPLWLILPGAVGGMCLGAAAVVFPLHLGVRTMRRMEF